jgi:hypothetical protein
MASRGTSETSGVPNHRFMRRGSTGSKRATIYIPELFAIAAIGAMG